MNRSTHSKIALIGGGTGSFTLLQSLKELTPNLTALVNMSDDGGSTGRLRDELGVLPPGDVRQCLVALSDRDEVRDLFSYRFDEGSLAGQSLGNMILSGLELRYGNFAKAVKVAGEILNIKGRVTPMTLHKHTLVMHDGDEVISGEFAITKHAIKDKSAYVRLEPEASINPDAKEAIEQADMVVIAPGNLYGSLLPALSVKGVKESLQNTNAKVVMVCNLVTKPGQTNGWHVVDYVKIIEKCIGSGEVDAVIYNDIMPAKELLDRYATDGEFPVAIDAGRFDEITADTLGAPLIAQKIHKQDPNDNVIRRTLIRHDSDKVAKVLEGFLGRNVN